MGNLFQMDVHIGATWKIRSNDCGDGDLASSQIILGNFVTIISERRFALLSSSK